MGEKYFLIPDTQYLVLWGGFPWQIKLFVVINPVFGSVWNIMEHNLLPGRRELTVSQIHFHSASLDTLLE